MQDEGVGERLGVGDVEGAQRDHGRRLEDAERRRRGGQHEREVDRDRHEHPGDERQVEMKCVREDRVGDAERRPRGDREGHPAQRDAWAAQRDEPAGGVDRDGLEALGDALALDAPQRRQQPVHGALVVAHDDEDQREQDHDDDAAEDRGGTQPGDLRKPRIGREQHDQQRQDIEQPLHDDGAQRLGLRRGRAAMQRDHAGGLAGACRQDVVEEVADQQRVGDRPQRRTLSR